MSLYDHCFVPSSFDYCTHVDIFKLNHNSLKEKLYFARVISVFFSSNLDNL